MSQLTSRSMVRTIISSTYILALLVGFFSLPVLAADAEPQSAKLSLEMGLFSKPIYRLGSNPGQDLYQDSALSPGFVQLLQPYPEAAEAAQQALGYQPYILTGTVLVVIGALINLMDTLNDAEDISNEKLPENKDDNTGAALGLVLIGGAVALVGGMNYRGSLNRAVDIYNEKRQGLAGAEPTFGRAGNHSQTQFGFSLVDESGKRVQGDNLSGVTLLANLRVDF